jgi:hypothetical protein
METERERTAQHAIAPHPYRIKTRHCDTHVGLSRWEIHDDDGLLQTSAASFATEQEARNNGRLLMQALVEMWNKK